MTGKKSYSASENRAPRRMLDYDESANYLSVTPRWMRRAVALRVIPHHKIGRLVRFDRRDLDAYLDAQRVGGSDVA